MIEAVLFDLGNTLMRDGSCDTRGVLEGVGRSLHDWLRQIGFGPPAYATYARRLRRRLIRAYLWARLRRREVPLMATTRIAHDRMGISLTEEHLLQMGSRCQPVLARFLTPDVEARTVLHGLRTAGLKLGVVSNTMVPGFAMDAHLKTEQLIDYLPVRIYSSEVGYKKPHRRIYHAALDKLRTRPDRTVFVGDCAVNDVFGPSRLGIKTILFAPNGHSPRRRNRPDFVVRRLSEIPSVLQAAGGPCVSI